MNKIVYSGIILLIAVILLVVDVVYAIHTPLMWLAAIGQVAVSYGIFQWHMEIIQDFKKSK